MNRRIFIRNTSLLTAGTLFLQKYAMASLGQSRGWAGNIKMIRDNVGIFTERGGTIGFILDDAGIVSIDSQFPDTAGHFIEEVKKLKDKPFAYLLNTHHHGDHTGGNIAFKGLVEHVVMHDNALKNHKAVAEKAKNEDKQLFADMTFADELKVKSGKAKIKGHYFGAAHTNGDAVYHIEKANVAHVGDLMFNRRHPVVDRSAGASIAHWTEVLQSITKKFDKDTIYIFGHAGEGYEVTGNAQDLLAFRNYLQKLLEFASSEMKAGKTREEFIKNKEVPEVPEWKGNGERTFGAAWDEVAGGK